MDKKSILLCLIFAVAFLCLISVMPTSKGGDTSTRRESSKQSYADQEKALIRDIYNKRSSCNRVETARWIGKQIFKVKVPGAISIGIEDWRQKRDDMYFFDVHYRLNGAKKTGMMAVNKADCRTIITKDI